MAEWRGIDLLRLLLVILFIIIPIYFVLLIYFVNLNGILILSLQLFQDIGPGITYFFIFPLVFSFTWWIFLYFLRNKIPNSFSIIREETSPIPTRWLIFYGVNALIMLAFFIIPLVSSIISIFGFFILAWQIVVRSDWVFERGKATLACYALIIFGFFLAFPILVQIEFWNDYVVFWDTLWASWQIYIPYFYSFSIVIVNALTIGSLLFLIFTGASEFERGLFGTSYERIPRKTIVFFEIILFIIFTLIWWQSIVNGGVFSWIYLVISLFCLFLAVLLFFISLIKSRRTGIRASILGYIYAILFMGIEGYRIVTVVLNYGIDALFSTTSGYPIELMTTTIFIASIIFIAVFLIAIIRAPEERSY